MSNTTVSARDMQDNIVALVKAEDYAGALSVARQGADLYPAETLAGGFTFATLISGLTAQLKPVNRPVSAAPVSAPAAAPVSAAPVSAPAARTRKAPVRKAPAAAPVSAAPVIAAPVSAPAVSDNAITIEYHPQHGTISRGEIGSEIFAGEHGWGFARKLGWHYLGDRGTPVAASIDRINAVMADLAAAGFDVRTTITGTEVPEVKAEAPATTRKRGTRQQLGAAPVSAAPVSAPAARTRKAPAAAPVSAAPVSAPAARTRKAPAAAPVSAAPAAPSGDLAAILAMLTAQGEAIAALQSGRSAAAPVSAPAAPMFVAPAAAPVSAAPAAPVADDIDTESAEDILSRVMVETLPRRTQEAAALVWRFIVRNGASAKHTASDLRSRLTAEVSGYYTDNGIGNVAFTVMRTGAELTVTVKSVSGDVVPSKLRTQVAGIGLTTRGIDKAQTVKAER
jgi:hypothetical protein